MKSQSFYYEGLGQEMHVATVPKMAAVFTQQSVCLSLPSCGFEAYTGGHRSPIWKAWEGFLPGLPDASSEPDARFDGADHQQLRVFALPALLLPEVRQ